MNLNQKGTNGASGRQRVGLFARPSYRGFNKPHRRISVTTTDGIALEGVHLHAGKDTLVIYCHGFLSSKNYLVIPRFVEMLAEDFDALAFDFRGHGDSQGGTTLGEQEVEDVGAVVNYAKQFDYRRVILMGSSMGGAVAIRYAGTHEDVDGVVTIGAFAHGNFSSIALQGLRLLELPVTHRLLRELRRTRIRSYESRSAPADVVENISPRPLLLIHGERDPLIPVSHARELYARAREPKQLIVIPRGSHDIPNLNRRTKEWIVEWASREA